MIKKLNLDKKYKEFHTDGRNAKNTVKITKLQYLRLYSGFTDENIKIEKRANRTGSIQYIANRMILTATIRELQDKLCKNDINVSIGRILSLKPFFIKYATEKEMALCLCKLCLNTKMMYDALTSKAKKEGDTMPASITEFFMSSCKCPKSQNGYYDWNCVSSKCSKCSSMQPVALSFQSSKDKVSYYQFQITKTLYVKTEKDNNEIIRISEKPENVLKNSSYEKLHHSLVSLKYT